MNLLILGGLEGTLDVDFLVSGSFYLIEQSLSWKWICGCLIWEPFMFTPFTLEDLDLILWRLFRLDVHHKPSERVFPPAVGTDCPVSGPRQTLVYRRLWSHSSEASAGTGTALQPDLWSSAFCSPVRTWTRAVMFLLRWKCFKVTLFRTFQLPASG